MASTRKTDLEALDELVAIWAAKIEDEPDPRRFTKGIIVETIALNQHYGERGPKIIAAAAWLAAENGAAGGRKEVQIVEASSEHTRHDAGGVPGEVGLVEGLPNGRAGLLRSASDAC